MPYLLFTLKNKNRCHLRQDKVVPSWEIKKSCQIKTVNSFRERYLIKFLLLLFLFFFICLFDYDSQQSAS